MFRYRCLALFLPAALLAALPAPASTDQARGIVISERIVEWQYLRASGEALTLVGREGEMVRVTREDGSTLGFTPVAAGEDRDQVRLQVFLITAMGEGREKVEKIGALELALGEERAVEEAGDGARVRVRRVVEPAAAAQVRDVVRWEVRNADGVAVEFRSWEGEIARFQDGARTFELGFLPAVESLAERRVRFQVFSFDGEGRRSARPVETVELDTRSEHALAGAPGYVLRLAGIEPGQGRPSSLEEPGTVRALPAAARGLDADGFRLPFGRPMVRWELALPDGTRASFRVRDGEEPRFTSKSLGLSLTFVPEVADARTGKLLLEIRRSGEGRAAGRSESLTLEPGAEAPSALVPGMVVRLLGAGEAPAAAGCAGGRVTGAASDRPTDPRDCCISCPPDGQTCGCAVSTECGSCCDPACCLGGGKRPR